MGCGRCVTSRTHGFGNRHARRIAHARDAKGSPRMVRALGPTWNANTSRNLLSQAHDLIVSLGLVWVRDEYGRASTTLSINSNATLGVAVEVLLCRRAHVTVLAEECVERKRVVDIMDVDKSRSRRLDRRVGQTQWARLVEASNKLNSRVPVEGTSHIVGKEREPRPVQLCSFFDTTLQEVLRHKPIEDKLKIVQVVQVKKTSHNTITDSLVLLLGNNVPVGAAAKLRTFTTYCLPMRLQNTRQSTGEVEVNT